MGILDSIKKLFGGGSSEPAAPEASTETTEAPAVPEMSAPEIGGGTDVGSSDQTPAV